ncbi:uncharacterized protein LOC135837406 isoform X1 [Planococcus citri]|uniref:uncharacterized protein LOC135837406 isoform X1 n=1 Tax=Planococcus citri TaxID=170843 RepID=UPI0031F95CD5
MAHDEQLQRYRDKIRKNNIGLSILLGIIIVINILALLHKHDKITRVDGVQLEISQKPADLDIHKLAILYDIYDTSPGLLNETFLENPDLEKKLEAHFIKEAVDRSLLMLQTALSTYAVMVLVIFNQPNSAIFNQPNAAKTTAFLVLSVSLGFDFPLLTYIPFTTVHNFLNDSLPWWSVLFVAALKLLGTNWIAYIGCLERKCWLISECNAPGMCTQKAYREQAAFTT